jgi:hypothetical protein
MDTPRTGLIEQSETTEEIRRLDDKGDGCDHRDQEDDYDNRPVAHNSSPRPEPFIVVSSNRMSRHNSGMTDRSVFPASGWLS